MRIRRATENDVASIAAVFTDSVHQIAARSYDAEQRRAWAPIPPDLERWKARLEPLSTFVADVGSELAGFISFKDTHVELLYTAPDHARQGVASKLYTGALETLEVGNRRLTTEASLEACPFFERNGFEVVEEQVVERDDVQLRRFLMQRRLQTL